MGFRGRQIATLTFVALVWSLAAPALAGVQECLECQTGCGCGCGCDVIGHEHEAAPCPDEPEHGPCDDGCDCLCCPGRTNVVPVSPGSTPDVPTGVTASSPGYSDAALPRGHLSRVFRPPRP